MKTEQDWENYHESEDQKIIKKIKKCNIRSTIYMLLGIGSVTGAGNLRGSRLHIVLNTSTCFYIKAVTDFTEDLYDKYERIYKSWEVF